MLNPLSKLSLPVCCVLGPSNAYIDMYLLLIDIYKIVSSKALETSADQITPGRGVSLNITPSAEESGDKAGGKCC